MANIDLDEKTARQLIELASANGLSVEDYVRRHLIANKEPSPPSDRLLGALSEESDLLDEVLSDANHGRENATFRFGADE